MSKIDIIIPTHNNEKTISKCLDSIFNQGFKDFRVIVVNDGSTDNTKEVLNDYINRLEQEDPPTLKLRRVSKIFIINQENKGANVARNRGFQESQRLDSSEYIIFCDADIQLKKNYLSSTLEILKKHPEKSYCYTSFKFGWKTFKLWPFDASKLKQMPCIHTTSLIRTKHFPGFDESIKRLQDWDLWLTMLEQGHTGIWLPQVLFKVKPKKGGLSRWLPKFAYKIPWLKSVKEYKEAVRIIKEKHGLV